MEKVKMLRKRDADVSVRDPRARSTSKATKDFLSGRFSIPTSLLVSSARVFDKFGGAEAESVLAGELPFEKVEQENASCPHLQKSIGAIPSLYHIQRKVEEEVQARYKNERQERDGEPQKKRCPYRMGCSVCVCLNCDFTCCLRCPGGNTRSHFSQTGHLLGKSYWQFFNTGDKTVLFCFKCGTVINELKEIECEKVILPVNSFTKDGRKALLKYLPTKFLDTLFSKKILRPPNTYCRGLVNFGKTCYINCIMQVLVHLPMVNSFFHDIKVEELTCKRRLMESTDKLNFLTVFLNLLQEFQTFDPVPICKSASILLALVWEKLPFVGFNKQHDAHEFFISVINLLHQELLQSEDDSLVDKLFLGRLQSEVTCTVCGHSRYTDDPFWDTALEVVSDGPRGSSMDLNDLLTRYTRIEQLDEYDLLHCTCCSKKTKSTKQLKFKVLPSVLCLQLKRFQHNPRYSGSSCFTKIKTQVHIPEKIDFSPFRCSARRSEAKKPRLDDSNISATDEEAAQNCYQLYAVVNHTGTFASGHYRTYIRKMSNLYIMCDDKIVKQVTKDEALKSEGYLLFYEKMPRLPMIPSLET